MTGCSKNLWTVSFAARPGKGTTSWSDCRRLIAEGEAAFEQLRPSVYGAAFKARYDQSSPEHTENRLSILLMA